MDWTIYSIGDIAYLEMIFNGLAGIVGSGDFGMIVQTAFLLGILIICVQAVYNGGGQIEWQTPFVALIVFSVLFGPTTRIHLEDAYTGQVRTVGNVPLGIAAVGTIVSNAGHTLTRLMEQGFGSPTQERLVSKGFGSNTSLLSQVRRELNNTTDWTNAADGGTGGNTDLAASWENYVADCTMKARDLYKQGGGTGAKSHADITTNSLPGALKFKSDVYGTKIMVDGTKEQSCTQAYQTLANATSGTAFEDDMFSVLAARVSMPGVPSDQDPTPGDVQAEINNALSAFNVGATQAQQYVVASALLPAFQAGVEQYHYDYREMMQAAQVNEAINQRNAQWRAQESVFESIMRPFMTFIEGLFYAIAPIIAFIIPLGSWGLSLAPKFLILAFWIQLWMPMLAIVNLYQHMTIEQKMRALTDTGLGGLPVDSIAGMMKADQILQNWQATGANLASAVPILAAVVAYGGNAFMMSRLMSQMQGAENIDPATSTPDVGNVGPAVSHAAAYDSGMNSGIAQQGTNQMHGGLSAAHSISASAQSAEQEVAQNREAFSSAYGAALKSTYGDSMTVQDATKLGEQFSASDSNVAQLLQSQSETFREMSQNSAGSESTLIGAVTSQAGGNIGFSKGALGGSGGITGQTEERDALKTSSSQSESFEEQINAIKQEVGAAQLQDAIAADVSEGRVDAASFSTQDEASADFRHSAEQLVSSQESYSAISALNEQYGSGAQMDAATASQQLAQNHGDEIDGLVARHGLTGEANELMENSEFVRHFPDADQRAAAAQMEVLAENGLVDELAAVAGFGAGGIDPNENAGIGGDADQAGKRARMEAETATADSASRANQAADDERNFDQREAQAPTAAEARAQVREQHGQDRAAVEKEETQAEAGLTDNVLREVNRALAEPPDDSAGHGFAGFVSEVTDVGLQGIAEGAWEGATQYDSGPALSAYHEAAREAEAGGSNAFSQMMAGTVAYWNDVSEQQGAAFAIGALESQGEDLQALHQAAFEHGKSMELTDTQAEYFASQSVNHALETLGGEEAVARAGFDADPSAVKQQFVDAGVGEQQAEHAVQYIDNAAQVPDDKAAAGLTSVRYANEAIDFPGSGEGALDTR